ncbi:MAG: EF-hand domain-containing protein [Acidobacteria bacterium]|nr:EF-hand domain-containing protein [Acidobacteriota bacterium]
MHKLLGSITLAAALFAGVPSLPGQASEDPAGQLFAQLDSNKDGKLTQSEFTALPDLTAELFKAWDADKDGAISKAEFVKNYGA